MLYEVITADNASVMVANIAEALAAADPSGAASYRAAAEAYRTALRDADQDARSLLEAIPADDRVVVSNHDSLGYFLDRYAIRQVGTVIPGLSTAAEPSARDIADLIDRNNFV